jgi:hypothetical protein
VRSRRVAAASALVALLGAWSAPPVSPSAIGDDQPYLLAICIDGLQARAFETLLEE